MLGLLIMVSAIGLSGVGVFVVIKIFADSKADLEDEDMQSGLIDLVQHTDEEESRQLEESIQVSDIVVDKSTEETIGLGVEIGKFFTTYLIFQKKTYEKSMDILKKIMLGVISQIKSLYLGIKKFSQSQIKKPVSNDQQISPNEESLYLRKEEDLEDLDTKFLEEEVKRNPKRRIEEDKSELVLTSEEQDTARDSETKVESFVEEMMKEDDLYDLHKSAKTTPKDTSSKDTSEYYTYMEKRYIKKIMQDPKDIGNFQRLGKLYKEMRNYQDARNTFKHVLKMRPNDALAHRELETLERLLQENR
jgi:tetratricopeptide (TPR) repeat protein